MPGQRKEGSHRTVSREREEKTGGKEGRALQAGEPACAKAGCQLAGNRGTLGVFWGAGFLLFRVHMVGGAMGRDLHLPGLGSNSLPCRVMGFSVWEPHDEREMLETFFWLWYGGMIE